MPPANQSLHGAAGLREKVPLDALGQLVRSLRVGVHLKVVGDAVVDRHRWLGGHPNRAVTTRAFALSGSGRVAAHTDSAHRDPV